MLTNDVFVEWMCYAFDKDGGKHRFVCHGSVNTIGDQAQEIVDHEWPGGTLQAVEHQHPEGT